MTDDDSALHKTDISSYVEACFRSFEELQSTSEYASHDLGTKLARFRSWVGNIGAHQRDQQSLDSRMRKIPQIRDKMLNILEELQAILANGRYTYTSFYQLCSGANEEYKARAIIRGERIPWDQLSDSDSDNDSAFADVEKEFTELDQLELEIDDTINCLFRLSMAIRNPDLYDMYVNMAPATTADTSIYLNFDIDHVRNKFPNAPEHLVINLGKAISQRREFFRHRQTQSDRLFKGIDFETISNFMPQYISENKLEKGTGSEPQISVSNPVPEEIPVISMDPEMDLRSQEGGLTGTSFATSNAEFQERQFKIPPIPHEGIGGNPFPCPFCFVVIAVNGRRSWKYVSIQTTIFRKQLILEQETCLQGPSSLHVHVPFLLQLTETFRKTTRMV